MLPQWAITKDFFPFLKFDKLMFIIPSDLSEAQRERERLTSSLSLGGVNVTVYTFESVKTVFVELFCTPQSSMENLSLYVSGHVSSMDRTFIVENYAENDFRQCWVCLAVQTIKGPLGEKKTGKGNRKRKGSIQKDWNRNFLATNRYKIPNGCQKKTLLVGPKERKVFQKTMMVFRKMGFRLYQSDKGADKDFP